MIGEDDVGRLRGALAAGGVAVVPTDTIYGIAAALDVEAGVERLYALKSRARSQPCQVLCYSPDLVDQALTPVPEVAAVVRALVPGTVTCIVPDPSGRFGAAAGDARGSVGLRVPEVDPPLAGLEMFLVATSANDPGGPDPATVDDIPARLLDGAAAVLDAGWLSGTPSSVIDLREVRDGRAVLLRQGPDAEGLEARLGRLGIALHRST